MKRANIRLWQKCNHKCIFCTNGEPEGKELSTEDAKSAIELALKNGVKGIDFTGGEPTLRKDLAELCSFAKKNGIKEVIVQTNGELLCKKDILANLKESGVDVFLVSIHSHKKEVSDRITQTESFEKTLQAIKNIANEGMNLIISFVVNKENFTEIKEFAEFICNISKKIRLHFSFVRPNGRAAENKFIVPRLSEVELYLHEAMEFCEENKILFSIEGVPLCYLDKFEKNSSEAQRIFEDSRIYIDYNGEEQDDAHGVINSKFKEKSSVCRICKASYACCGVWKEYADIFGTKELYPLFEEVGGLKKNG